MDQEEEDIKKKIKKSKTKKIKEEVILESDKHESS